MRVRRGIAGVGCAAVLVLTAGCGSSGGGSEDAGNSAKDDTTTTVAKEASTTEAEMTEPSTTAVAAGCTTSGTAGDWTLDEVPTESSDDGFVAQYDTDTGPVEFAFGLGAGGGGRPYLQVSGGEDVWFAEIPAFDPTTGVTVQASLESDMGGNALAVDLTVTC